MDQLKVGKLLKELRSEKGLTQEELGEKLYVTNKTISRWENGNYMPDIETFQMLSEIYDVSINELLLGCKDKESEYNDEYISEIKKDIEKNNIFTRKEHEKYWKNKWRKEHIFEFILGLGVILLVIFILPKYISFCETNKYILIPLSIWIIYGYFNNKMMIYVEKKMY